MNARDVLYYGQKAITSALEGISDQDAENGYVTKMWNVRDVIGHLAAYEHVLEEVLEAQLLASEDTSFLREFMRMSNEEFNQFHYEQRRYLPFSEVKAELTSSYNHIMGLMGQFTETMLRRAGSLPWYGEQYSLEDFIIYHTYGHKREHAAQIRSFKKHLDAMKSVPTKHQE